MSSSKARIGRGSRGGRSSHSRGRRESGVDSGGREECWTTEIELKIAAIFRWTEKTLYGGDTNASL